MRAGIVGLGLLAALVAAVAAEPPKPVVVTLDGLKSTAPAGWKAEKPANRLRDYQFKVPRAVEDKEDAEVFVLNFVRGTGAENIARLKERFLLPTDMPREKAVREWEFKNSRATLTCLDIQGTYYVKNKPIDTAVKEVRPDYRMIAAVWLGKEHSYSICLIGPKKTVEARAQEFERWLRNFR